jgi:hypothetical protein
MAADPILIDSATIAARGTEVLCAELSRGFA